ncbi:hypothetical protein PBCVNEJV1_508R [Paramecium bursaria Chlorella virus NE-JV-1]|nr:hypothetical protein PBCVNEJV1_508R [Paramecium bursaria Chlorella virus NE-JV-1]
MIADILKSLKDLASQPDVKEAFRDIVDPCMKYADQKIHSVTFFFQIIAIMILIQCMATLFLIILEVRRNL